MDKKDKIYVAGHKGLVGSAVVRALKNLGYNNIITRTHNELDLLSQSDVMNFFEDNTPDYVVIAAARVGGIVGNSEYPANFSLENSLISTNLIWASYKYKVKKLMNLGTTCIYPKDCPQPIKEEYLLTGYMEQSNIAYALAKINAIQMCTAFNKQYGTNFLSVMPCNLYGRNDTYDINNGHVLPNLIHKFHQASKTDRPVVTLWGDGTPYREFMCVDDLARIIVSMLRDVNVDKIRHSAGDFINVGTGKDIQLKNLAAVIGNIICGENNYEIKYDTSKPNGTMRKVTDVTRLHNLNYSAHIPLEVGIKEAYADYLARFGDSEGPNVSKVIPAL
jgi:GDP-L-fucose synthase